MSPPCSPRAASGHTSPPRRCYRSVARISRHRVVVTSSAARAKTTSEGGVGRFQPDVRPLDRTMSSSARLVAAIKGTGHERARSVCTASRWRKHAPSGAAGLTADLGERQEFERETGSYQTGEVARRHQSNRHHHASGGSRTRGTTKRPTDAAVGLFTRHPTAKYGKRGRRQRPRSRRKSLQSGPTQKQPHTTENRGVPGSSPGLPAVRFRHGHLRSVSGTFGSGAVLHDDRVENN
jgi:hypothetical protein